MRRRSVAGGAGHWGGTAEAPRWRLVRAPPAWWANRAKLMIPPRMRPGRCSPPARAARSSARWICSRSRFCSVHLDVDVRMHRVHARTPSSASPRCSEVGDDKVGWQRCPDIGSVYRCVGGGDPSFPGRAGRSDPLGRPAVSADLRAVFRVADPPGRRRAGRAGRSRHGRLGRRGRPGSPDRGCRASRPERRA